MCSDCIFILYSYLTSAVPSATIKPRHCLRIIFLDDELNLMNLSHFFAFTQAFTFTCAFTREHLVKRLTIFFPLFFPISDTPSPNKIRPLVNPNTFQITSRGRVAFTVVPVVGHTAARHASASSSVGSIDSHHEDNGSKITSISSMINYLSPEYISCVGKKVSFTESDIEKVSGSLSLYLVNYIQHATTTISVTHSCVCVKLRFCSSFILF